MVIRSLGSDPALAIGKADRASIVINNIDNLLNITFDGVSIFNKTVGNDPPINEIVDISFAKRVGTSPVMMHTLVITGTNEDFTSPWHFKFKIMKNDEVLHYTDIFCKSGAVGDGFQEIIRLQYS